MRGILSAIAIALLISVGNLRADYQHDQDVNKAAQQLKDTDDAQRAEAQREEEKKQFNNSELSDGGKFVLGIIVVVCCVGGTIWVAKSIYQA
jgi:hypothetical protein